MAWREHGLKGGHGGVTELPTMLIGDSRVSHIVVRRREFTRCALKEEARRGARVGFDHVPHRADEVRRDELVVPRERGGVGWQA